MTTVSGISANNYLNGRIDYTQWLSPEQNSLYDTNEVKPNSDGFEGSSKEKCTDGKDDGKIGLFSKIGHAIKGVGKSITNGIKGMFTNKEGKFSIGKTLLSIGTVAACVAFPAVGVGLCAVGAVSGAVQIGKGISAASKATTDAEAKEAWQNIGAGAFTVAASVAGAKAGIKATANAAAATKAGSQLNSLEQGATLGQKLNAFKADAITSSKASLSNLGKTATAIRYKNANAKLETAQLKNESAWSNNAQEINLYERGMSDGSKIESTLKIAQETDSALAQAEANVAKYNNAGTQAQNNAAKLTNMKNNIKNTGSKVVDAAKHPVKTAKTGIKKAGSTLSEIKNAGVKGNISKLNGAAKSAAEFLTKGEGTYAEAVQQFGYNNVAEALKVVGATELNVNNQN